jgi:hypothetical protein
MNDPRDLIQRLEKNRELICVGRYPLQPARIGFIVRSGLHRHLAS